MKNFALTALAVVTLTMLAGTSAQAQTGYPGTYYGNNTQLLVPPYSSQYVPAAYPTYGTGSVNPACPNGRCGTGYTQGTCANGRCGTACAAGTCANGRCGTTTGYRSNYPIGTRPSLGTTLGSWFGLNPRPNSYYPTTRPVAPYGYVSQTGPAPYGSTVNYGSNPFYNN